jgi:hypothetical protein
MLKSITVAILLTSSFVGQSFAQVNPQNNVGAGVLGQNCTTTIMCCIPSGPNKGCWSPNTTIGYQCNDGRAQPVTTCTKTPRKLKQ